MDILLVIAVVIVFIVLGRLSSRSARRNTASWDNARKSWDHVFPSQEHDRPKKN